MTNLFDVEIKTISLDDLENRTFANEFPRLFLEMHPWPIIIQEIQNAIPLLRAIRETVDDERERLAYDLYYIKHRNVWWDIAILVKAVFLACGGRHK